MPSKDEELAAEIRGVFEPEDGEYWFDADVSQQEFRILVDKGEQYGLPGAREMADVYRNDPDADVHAMVATMVELERKLAKGCNFAKVYGMGVPAFAAKIGKSVEEARAHHGQVRRQAAVRERALRYFPEDRRAQRLHRAARRRAPAFRSLRSGQVEMDQGRRAVPD